MTYVEMKSEIYNIFKFDTYIYAGSKLKNYDKYNIEIRERLKTPFFIIDQVFIH